jgi:hypothetical protein
MNRLLGVLYCTAQQSTLPCAVLDATIMVGWLTMKQLSTKKEKTVQNEQHELLKQADKAQEAVNRKQHDFSRHHETKNKSTPKHAKPVVINQPRK